MDALASILVVSTALLAAGYHVGISVSKTLPPTHLVTTPISAVSL